MSDNLEFSHLDLILYPVVRTILVNKYGVSANLIPELYPKTPETYSPLLRFISTYIEEAKATKHIRDLRSNILKSRFIKCNPVTNFTIGNSKIILELDNIDLADQIEAGIYYYTLQQTNSLSAYTDKRLTVKVELPLPYETNNYGERKVDYQDAIKYIGRKSTYIDSLVGELNASARIQALGIKVKELELSNSNYSGASLTLGYNLDLPNRTPILSVTLGDLLSYDIFGSHITNIDTSIHNFLYLNYSPTRLNQILNYTMTHPSEDTNELTTFVSVDEAIKDEIVFEAYLDNIISRVFNTLNPMTRTKRLCSLPLKEV
jgi:hypothetical protein